MVSLFFMTQGPPSEATPSLPAATGESTVSPEIPFSLTWLNAIDPRTFTPQTWENGRETTIRLRAGDDSARVNVHRVISHYLDGEIDLKDEAYALALGETEAGSHQVSQFRYSFDSGRNLTTFDPSPRPSEHAESIVSAASNLVYIVGSTITASNFVSGKEAEYVSDGTQWVEAGTGTPAPARPAIAAGGLDQV